MCYEVIVKSFCHLEPVIFYHSYCFCQSRSEMIEFPMLVNFSPIIYQATTFRRKKDPIGSWVDEIPSTKILIHCPCRSLVYQQTELKGNCYHHLENSRLQTGCLQTGCLQTGRFEMPRFPCSELQRLD